MDPLFPEMPEDITALSDEELTALLAESEQAAKMIREDDKDFLKGLSADEVITQMTAGVQQVLALRAEQEARVEAHETYKSELDKLGEALEVKAEAEPEEAEEAPAEEPVAEAEEPVEEVEEAEAPVEERELVLASAEPEPETKQPQQPRMRRAPAPAAERAVVSTEPEGAALVAAGEMSYRFKEPLTPKTLAEVVIASASHLGPHPKIDAPGKFRFGGPEHRIAHADFDFPEERRLTGDLERDTEKIKDVIVETMVATGGRYSLTASGGLCAPLTPIYSMPNFAVTDEPVWASLPVFQAARGGVNVPTPTTIGDITTAITSISEEEDALGGTWATKSCQGMDCPDYTEVAVNIIAHCREYGNLNARAWPEKIEHENALTMAALSRTSETFVLDRIKGLSINVTQAETLGAYGDLVNALTKAASGIRYRLRMSAGARFNVVLPEWIANLLAADSAYTQFTRYDAQATMIGHLESLGFRVVLYKDDVTGGTSQGFSDEAAGALDDFPDDVQYAIYPEGQFLGIDMGVLELGIVRDSTLNATNDFQVFGERFRNVAMLGPAQGALWVTQGICPSGEFPDLGTALSC